MPVAEMPQTTSRTTPAHKVLSPDVIEFVDRLDLHFEAERLNLLNKRKLRQAEFDAGMLPGFLPETLGIRNAAWCVAPIPAELADRRVEITGPTDRKMVINALNSGARVFMADFEDSTAPTWANVIEGQQNLYDANRRTFRSRRPRGRSIS